MFVSRTESYLDNQIVDLQLDLTIKKSDWISDIDGTKYDTMI